MDSKKIKILYIEDNPINRDLVRHILELEVFDYFEAEEVLSGIELAKKINPDIILMDINMVGMSGTEATIKIKQMPEISKIPIIAVTGRTMKGDREKILAAGCAGYIPKPINIDSFQKRILEIYQGSIEKLDETEWMRYLKETQVDIVQHLEGEIGKLEDIKKTLKENVDELEKKNKELKHTQKMLIHSEKLAAAGRMVAGIIHEIRTPLTGIMGYHELLKIKIHDPVLTNYLSYCINAVDKIKNIVSNMLNFSKRGSDFAEQVFDLQQIFNNVEGLIGILSKQENIKISVLFPDENVYIRANPGQIEQIIMTLVDNATYAVKNRAIKNRAAKNQAVKTPSLDTDQAADDESTRVSLSGGVLESSKEIFIQVSDHGMGISEEIKKHIFEPFFTTKPLGEGTGLGLAICKTIVESFNGRITVDSEIDEGTTFKVFFPPEKYS